MAGKTRKSPSPTPAEVNRIKGFIQDQYPKLTPGSAAFNRAVQRRIDEAATRSASKAESRDAPAGPKVSARKPSKTRPSKKGSSGGR